MSKKSTKKALAMSVISLLACVAMLVSTTFAWFTDSVTSANNVIKSGNLDIELEYWNGTEWLDVSGKADILTNDLFEPGVVEVAYLRLANVGSLALKYAFGVNIVSETPGVNQANASFNLSDYIEFGVVEGVNGENAAYADRKTAVAALSGSQPISQGYGKAANMMAGEDLYLALVVYMPESVDNVANHHGIDIPQIDLGINVFATQYTYEEDSFDETYDAASAAFTVAEANALMADGKAATLVNCIEPDGILNVPASYTGTLTLVNSTIKSVQAAQDADIVIKGNVVINAKGVSRADFDGSAISAKGDLTISGNGILTAIAADANGAFGIGGMEVKSVTINDITIDYVSGGYVQPNFINDTKYGKSEPEGGAAIGSAQNGAVINLTNVTINKAEGGSKAAAIGARYWTGVTINITDCYINAIGGNASAAIGSSRVSSGAAENGTTINISDSTIVAQGGQYAAGIGSGYDTHCASAQPLCTINIADSDITAIGGQYAAGVGTGYHNAALAGEIKNSTVNATSGDKFYKDAYTEAMDIGFGVVDPAREGVQTDSYIIYNGVKILCNAVNVATVDDLKTALEAGKNVVMENDLTVKAGEVMVNGGLLDGGDATVILTSGITTNSILGATGGTIRNVVVDGAGKSCQGIGAGMTDANPLTKDLYLDNVVVDNVMYAVIGTANDGVKVIVTDSELYGAFSYLYASVEISDSILGCGWSMMAFYEIGGNADFTNCAFVDDYCFMAYDFAAGSTVTFTNCTVDGTQLTADNFKSLLIDTRWDYSSELSSTNVKNCTIVIDGVTVVW